MGTEKQKIQCFFMISIFLDCDLQLEAIRECVTVNSR